MVELTKEYLQEKIDWITSPKQEEVREDAYFRYQVQEGYLKDIVFKRIEKEFKSFETQHELKNRIININVFKKFLKKLAMVYKQSPIRKSFDDSPDDNELLNIYIKEMRLNQRGKEANKFFKNFKKVLIEMAVSDEGKPVLKNLPRHTYEVFSDSKVTPYKPSTIVKIMKYTPQSKIFHFWTDNEFLVVNEKAEIIPQLESDGKNTYGTLPFGFISESSQTVNPIINDDIFNLSVVIPIILSDLAMGQKYQAWSLIYTVGLEGDIPVGPNKVVNLDFGPNGERPSIETIKPSIDTQGVLDLLEFIVSMLLTTNDLSVSTIKTSLNAQNAASGIAKLVDNAESMEDREDQQEYFKDLESQIFTKLHKNLIPVWQQQRLLSPDFMKNFSESFDYVVLFPEPKIMHTLEDRIRIAKMRKDAGFSTLRRELEFIYSDLDSEDIDKLEKEILDNKMDDVQSISNEMNDMDEDGI